MSQIIIITWDAVRPDGLAKANTPWLDSMIKKGGAFCANGKTIMPSNTQPAHTSLFYGSDTKIHNLTVNNTYPNPPKEYKTLFDYAYDAGLHTGAFIGWEAMKLVYGKVGSLQSLRYHKNSIGHDCKCFEEPENQIVNDRYVDVAIEYYMLEKPDLSHLYFPYPDMVGHKNGWMSDEYISAIEETDEHTRRFFEALDKAGHEYTIFLTTDHGGHNFDHGTEANEDMNTWMFAYGKGIKTVEFDSFKITDIAPTVATYLNLPIHPLTQGKPLDILD